MDNRSIHTTRLRNAQFVSFLGSSDIHARSTDRYDGILRRRRLFRIVARLAATAGAAWIVIESAKALVMF